MLLFGLVLIFFITVYMTYAASQLQRDIEYKMGVVQAHEAHGFAIIFRVKTDRWNVCHVTCVREFNNFTLISSKNTKILFVVPVLNAEQAGWFIMNNYPQARRYTFNTMYLTLYFRISMLLVNDRELQKELQLCV